MFDLLVSDVVMPVMDGPTMVKQARKKFPDLPILFMSGYAEEQLAQDNRHSQCRPSCPSRFRFSSWPKPRRTSWLKTPDSAGERAEMRRQWPMEQSKKKISFPSCSFRNKRNT
jgi:CheY-like chemotaxis protein